MKDRQFSRLWIAVCATLAATPALAQQAPQAAAGQGGVAPLWLISCSNQANPTVLSCEFSQSIVMTQGNQNQRVATVSFVKDVGQPEKTAVLTLPVGIYLPAGVTASVDGRALAKAEFTSCGGQACQATAPVDAEWLDAMRGGDEMILTVESLDRRPVSFSFQLKDFTTTESLLP